MRRRPIWAVGILAIAASATLPPVSAGATTPSAATLYRQALATTRSWSVHYAFAGSYGGVTILTSGDAGPASGIQVILVGKAGVTESATLIVIGGVTYIKGNAAALTDLTGLSATEAEANVGNWARFATTNRALASTVSGIRSRDVAQELALIGPFTLGPSRTIDGIRVDAIRGRQRLSGRRPISAVLYVRATGSHVPVEEDSLNAQGQPNGIEHTVYSHWNLPVRPAAPDASISIGPVGTT